MKRVYKGLFVLFLSMFILFIEEDNERICSADGHTFVARGEIPRGYDLKVNKIDASSYDIRIEDKNGNEWQPRDYGKEVEITISDAGGYVKHENETLQTQRVGGYQIRY